jgi:glutathione S-transferase
MLQMGSVRYDFHPVDQFKGEHKKESYLKINPTGSLPTMTEGRFLILGGYLVFLSYLANHHKGIREKLYPAQ